MMYRIPVDVVVPVRSEGKALVNCLSRLHRFARIWIVDSDNSPATQLAAERHGASYLVFSWDGRFPKKRNWFLRSQRVKSPWVLFLDADELVDDAFCDELAATLPTTPHVGFWLTYDNWFMGRRLRHGTPNRKLALFRVGAGEYERIEEDHWSHLDMEIHEHPVLTGSVGHIRARIDHRDDRGLEHWKRRHEAYATWEAKRAVALLRAGTLPATRRQYWKYRLIAKRWLPWAFFLDNYVRRLGFLDGWAGFRYAWLKSRYFADVGRRIRAQLVEGASAR